MPVRVVSSRDSQPITVNSLVANPLVIPERIVSELKDQFVMDQVLRNGGSPKGGAVQYRVSSGIFADRASEIVAEGGLIPVTTVTRGDLQTKPTEKRALGVVITKEMRDRDQIGEVERQLMVVKNTIVRDIDGAFFNALAAATTQSRAATAVWSSGTATIRKDINAIRLTIKTAVAPSTTAAYMAFEPDTLLISPQTEADLLNSTEFTQLIYGQVNPSNVATLADVPEANILGLKPLVSVSVPAGTAYVVQSRQVGFYADEVPLEATALYENPPTQTWRSDAYRTTVAGIDQPLAVGKITGV